MTEFAFLDHLYDLEALPSTDPRFVTFCDGRTFFATASGQTQLTADILAAVQVVRPRLAAGAPRGPRLRADSDRNREEDGA
jgi:hypothetical protein